MRRMTRTALTVAVAAILSTLAPGAAYAHDDQTDQVTTKAEGEAALHATPFANGKYGPGMVKGEAELSERDGRLVVKAEVEGLTPGTTHIGHIHFGDCTALSPGTIIHDLTPITISSDGEGSSVTVIDTKMGGSLTQVQDCQWWVAFHEGPANSDPQTPAVAVGPVYVERD